MRRLQGGYTIVEVMIFLAISLVIFVSAQLVFQGQQGRTQFEQGMHDAVSKVQQYVGQVSASSFPGEGQYSCATSASTGRAALSSGGSAGTNQDCLFLGYAMQVVPTQSNIYIYTVLGNRTDSSGSPASSIAAAQPEPAVSNGANLTQTYATNWGKILSSSQTLTSGATATSDLVGFYNNLDANYSELSGGQSTLSQSFSFTSTDPNSVNSSSLVSCLEQGASCSSPQPIQSWTICFQSLGSSQTAQLVVNATPAGITEDVNFVSCN